MRKKIIIGNILMFCGIGFIIEGFIFQFMSWPDLFQGLLTGSLLIVISIVFFIRANKKNEESFLISSNLTFVIKYFVTTFLIILFLFFVWFFSFIEVNSESSIFAVIYGSFLFIGIVWSSSIFYRIVKLEYDNDYLIINEKNKLPIYNVTSVTRILPNLYKINTKDAKVYRFVPHHYEVFSVGLIGTPQSIKMIRDKIDNK